MNTNPLFVDAASNNYHLQASSAAIGAGVTLAAVPLDFDGLTRPQQNNAFDIGAFEFP